MSSQLEPFEQDIEWLKNESRRNGLSEPTENSEEAFAEKVSILCTEKSDVKINSIRSMAFSEYIWGRIGDMPDKLYSY